MSSLMEFRINVLDRMQNGGCVGINKYLTFTNFTADLQRMKKEYLNKYSTDLSNSFGSETILYPPAYMTVNQKGLDCKQFTLWTLCLANYYPNVSCMMYHSEYDTGEQHVGLECIERIGNTTYTNIV